MFGFNKKQEDPRIYDRPKGRTGSMTDADYERAIGLIKAVGSEEKRGFFIIGLFPEEPTEKDKAFGYTEGDGMMKVSNVNMMDMLDGIQQSVGMDDEDMLKYLLANKMLDN